MFVIPMLFYDMYYIIIRLLLIFTLSLLQCDDKKGSGPTTVWLKELQAPIFLSDEPESVVREEEGGATALCHSR